MRGTASLVELGSGALECSGDSETLNWEWPDHS